MDMDNRVFDVNGYGDEGLCKALELAFLQNGERTTCKGFVESADRGLILLWSNEGDSQSLPAPMEAAEMVPIIKNWLKTDFANSIELEGWHEEYMGDASNTKGWRVYVEDWGHVDKYRYSICAISPAYAWHGK